MTRVSVVIPTYNSMAYLPETMATVLSQTHPDFEVIVINDGSTDNTQEWVSQINDSRVKLVSQENRGLAGARNRGIEESQGEYLAFLDADDLWQPSKLAEQANMLDNHPEVGVVCTWVTYINQAGDSTGRIAKNHHEGHIWQQLTQSNLVECGSVAMVRRECLTKCGVFDCNLGSFVEDWDMWLRIARHYQFKVVQQPLVAYRQIASSASRNWQAMAQSYQLVLEKAFSTASWSELPLRNRSYGTANLVLAWKALQCLAQDYQQAKYFRSLALKHDPWLFWSKEYFRLSVAIAIVQWFGADSYQQFIALLYGFRRGFKFNNN